MTLFSVITPWKARPELKRTLEANAGLFARHSVEVVIVNCGGDADELALIVAGAGVAARQIALPIADFNQSLARNIGVSLSSGRYLFLLDADIVLRSDVFAEAREEFEQRSCIMILRRLHETEPRLRHPRGVQDELVTRDVVSTGGRLAVLHGIGWSDGSHSGPGQILVEREQLLRVGGFNSALTGWGFEDLDFQLRVQFVTGVPLVPVGEAEHLSHTDATRAFIGESPDANNHRNLSACVGNYRLGKFEGTYDEDVRLWRHRTREVGAGAMLQGSA